MSELTGISGMKHNTPQASKSGRALDVNRRAVDVHGAYEKNENSSVQANA